MGNMLYMCMNFLDYIMFIIVMVMSRDIVSYVICMFYFLCEILIITKINKFINLSYTDIIISVYGITCIGSNIINKHIICIFRCETLLVLRLLTTSVAYWCIFLDMLFVLLNVIFDLLLNLFST